jgi:phosphoadenosine phosphosulfate reductase
MENDSKLVGLNEQLNGKTIADSLKILVSHFPGKVIFSSSFGIEDQVITHIIFSNDIPIEVATLDTGRLFPETYRVFSETILKYNKRIKVYFPDKEEVEELVSKKGPYSFYESKDNREECCRIRKVHPLNRALDGTDCWISGIRSSQSENRSFMNDLEYDKVRKIFKYHPLFHWSLEDVEEFIKQNNVPYNSLHDKGYPSIGCEPCTRAVLKGQDIRSGRWWWENDGAKECGCHVGDPNRYMKNII